MKKISLVFLFFISTLFLFSCASKTASETVEEPVIEEVIPLFDDWEYKGFGNELPDWVEPAYCDNTEALSLCFPEESITVTKSYGINSDMAMAASNLETPALEAWPLLKEIWVRVNPEHEILDEPYIAIKIYKEKSEN